MNVYQLKEMPYEYKALQLGPTELFAAIGKQHLMTMHRQRSQNTSLVKIWKNVAAAFDDVLGQDSRIPDVSLWAMAYLVLSSRAYELLEPTLKNEGEFLSVSMGEEQVYIFNCLSFGKEDESVCVKKYLDGIEDGYATLHFDESDIEKRYLFKSRLEGCQRLYATDSFKRLCEYYDLQGLRFEEDLLGVF
ncbi:hypothetical protein [Vibrio cincinnatiensis]